MTFLFGIPQMSFVNHPQAGNNQTIKSMGVIYPTGVHMKLFQTFLASKACDWAVVLWIACTTLYLAFSNLSGPWFSDACIDR